MTTVLAAEAATSAARFVQLDIHAWQWALLVGSIVALLVADLLLVHRKPHAISVREALIESSVWIAISVVFGVLVGVWFGWPASGEYFGGYLIEKSLSVDNVFVWAVIFSYFRIPTKYQFRVLFWGVFGALVLRAIFIFAGVALLDRFSWLLYVFGALLLFTAYRLVRDADHEMDPARNPVMRLVKRVVPSTDTLDGQRMFTRVDGKLLATPLFAVLLLVEFTDVIFAVDSVPAILAVSREPFIVFSSNAFAILGLRALYFALAGMKDRFRYLDEGLAAILVFVGVKMLLLDVLHVPTGISLAVIVLILGTAIWASLAADRRDPHPAAADAQEPHAEELTADVHGWTIRSVEERDLDAVRALNEANVPDVGPLDDARLALFTGEQARFWLAERDGAVGAIFVGLFDGVEYDSPNYRWFATRYPSFAYVDRIAVAEEARGTGLAAALYERWEQVAREAGVPVLCAEVNTEPPNPRSLAFHARRGFVRVDEVAPYGDDQRVAMLVNELAPVEARERVTTSG